MLFQPENVIPLEAWLEVLDVVDLGIVVVDRGLVRVRLANRDGLAALASFGEQKRVPAAVREALQVDDADALPDDRFTRAVEVPAPRGQHYFVRGRRLAPKIGGALVTMNLARLRRDQVIDLVHRRLGLSDGTIRQYLSAIYSKLGITSKTQLIALIEENIPLTA